MERNIKIFVYGTLRWGFGNHKYFLSKADFISYADTSANYSLVVKGLPYMIERKGSGGVRGEMYYVNERELEAIDGLEGHPNFYKRIEEMVKDDYGIKHRCYMYLHPDSFDNNIELHYDYRRAVDKPFDYNSISFKREGK